MTIFNAIIVMRAVYICRNNRGKVTAILLIVAFIHHIDHAFCISIACIRIMWWTSVKHSFVNRIRGLVWENTGRQTRNFKNYNTLSLVLVFQDSRTLHYVPSFFTLKSLQHSITLSFIITFSLKNSTLYFKLRKSPPTIAAKWITCVG